MSVDLSDVLVALLSMGGATFVWFATRSWLALRAGARSRERDAWDDMLDHNDYLDARARLAEMDRDYLRQALAYARWQLTQAGITPEPRDVVLPSERLPEGWRPSREQPPRRRTGNGLRATQGHRGVAGDDGTDAT